MQGPNQGEGRPATGGARATGAAVSVAAVATVAVCAGVFWLVATPGAGQVHWATALLITAAGLFTFGLFVRGRERAAERAAWIDFDGQLRALEADARVFFENISRDVEPQFAGIRAEAEQIGDLLLDAIEKLVASFTAMNLASKAQRDHALRLVERQRQVLATAGDPAQALDRLRQLEPEAARAVEELSAIAADFGGHVNAAVTSLQFQDLSSQLLGQILRRVDSLQRLSHAIGGASVSAANSDLGDGADLGERLARWRRTFDRCTEEIAGQNRNSVVQSEMKAREIELF